MNLCVNSGIFSKYRIKFSVQPSGTQGTGAVLCPLAGPQGWGTSSCSRAGPCPYKVGAEEACTRCPQQHADGSGSLLQSLPRTERCAGSRAWCQASQGSRLGLGQAASGAQALPPAPAAKSCRLLAKRPCCSVSAPANQKLTQSTGMREPRGFSESYKQAELFVRNCD